MDKMTFAEVRFFLDGLAQRNRESWEQTRIIGYIMAQANSTKSLKQTDILRFPWDEQEASKDTFVSSEDVDRLRALAKQYES